MIGSRSVQFRHSPIISPIMSKPSDTTVMMNEPSGGSAGAWKLMEVLGRGGMATVYRGETAAGKVAAVKVFPRNAPGDVATIVNEAMAMQAVRDPYVVTASSCGEDAGSLYLIMEYLPGGDTKTLTADRQRLKEPEILAFAEQCARGLQAIHAAGFLHRDLKPSNVMIDGCGNAKIVDLGLVFPLRRDSTNSSIIGTPAYMSPEQARGETLDTSTDLWSLGATMWHWAVGHPPFSADHISDLINQVVKGPVPDPRSAAPMSIQLRDLILGLMERRPAFRFKDAGEVVKAIRAIRSGNPDPLPRNAASSAAQPDIAFRPSRLAFAAGAAVALMAVIGSAFALSEPSRASVAAPPAIALAEPPNWAVSHVVRWISDDRLRLNEVGLMRYERSGTRALFSGGALACGDASSVSAAMMRAEAFTIEIELTPADLIQQGPARIVSLSLNHRLCNLMIGQSGSRLEARCRTTTTSSDGTRPSLATPEGTLTGKLQHVAFVRHGEHNELWVDGIKVAAADVPGSLAVWDPAFPLIIGDENRGGYAWNGAIDRLAFHARAMDANEISDRARHAGEVRNER